MARKTPSGVPQPFKLSSSFKDPVRRALFSMIASPLEHSLGLSRLNHMYADVITGMQDDRNFLEKTLAVLDIRYSASPEDIARIPKTGPVIVVANHPFGGLDGVILAALLRTVRPDVKVMANYLLGRIPDLRDFMIYVDPFGGPNAVRKNIRAMKTAMEYVNSGGMLTIFPAGEVSHIDLQKRAIVDPAWSHTVARIIRNTHAPVLPVFFSGSNSTVFNVLGLLHPLLRTAMLPRELLNKRKTTVQMLIGNVIPFKKLSNFTTNPEMTAYLRLRTYLLQNRADSKGPKAPPPVRPLPKLDPVVPARDPALLREEVAGLPVEHLLIEHGEYRVYCARSARIPQTMYEIGRLRELTFRDASEGTGKSLDLDRFDEAYHHLFVWNKFKQELVGAYRMGPTDEILPQSGVDGLYTSTLFQYQAQVLEQVGPALELGRSFIRSEYQKSYSPLLLLWRGIAAFITIHPRYQVLFGPVSINSKYESFSRMLIMTFMQANNSLPMAKWVKAKNPPQVRPGRAVDLRECSTVVRDMDEVSDLIAEIETDQKGIPVLLKQYLKLSGKMLGFNIDPDFGDVLDGLILVDLRQVNEKILERFAGDAGAATIRAYGKTHPAK